jgi:cytochrome bd-type quinol oxidase subunit 2
VQTTEERVLAVKLRSKEIASQNRIRKQRTLKIGSFAGSLLIIVTVSFIMPGVMNLMSDNEYSNIGMAAGIFDGGSFLGYVILGLLSFALGVSVTILSYKIKQRNLESRDD